MLVVSKNIALKLRSYSLERKIILIKTWKMKLNLKLWMSLEMFLVILININTVFFQNEFLTSVLHGMTFVLLLLASFLVRFSPETILLIIVSSFSVVLNFLMTETALEINRLSKLIFFFSSVLIMYYSNIMNVTEKLKEKVLFSGVIVAGIYTGGYYVLGNDIMYGSGLTLGFTNPNFFAFWIFHAIIYCTIYLFGEKRKIKKCIVSIFMVGLLALLNETRCRSVLVALFVFFILIIIRVVNNKFALKKSQIVVLCTIPLLIPVFYNVITTKLSSFFSFMVSEGKSLSSRTVPWTFAFEHIMSHPLFGNYNEVVDFELGHMHNIYLEVLTAYGLIVFVAFFALLVKMILTLNEQCITLSRYAAVSGLICVMIYSTFEASLITGSLGLIYLTAGLVLLSRNVEHSDTDDTGKINNRRKRLKC